MFKNSKIISSSQLTIYLINILFIIVFICILTNLKKFNESFNKLIIQYLGPSQLLYYLVLILIVCFNVILCSYSKLSAGILFIIFIIIIKHNINKTIYVEPFNNVETNSDYIKQSVMNQLKEQVSNDPNITSMEKTVINDIYDKYFLQSENLDILTEFNNKASEFNPVNNDQQIKDILNFYK